MAEQEEAPSPRPEAPRFLDQKNGKQQRFSFSAVSPEKKYLIKVTEHKPKKDAQSNPSVPDKQKKRKVRKQRVYRVKPDAVNYNKDGRKKETKRIADHAQKKKDKRGASPANSKKKASKGQSDNCVIKSQLGMLLFYVIAHTWTSSKNVFLSDKMWSMYPEGPKMCRIADEAMELANDLMNLVLPSLLVKSAEQKKEMQEGYMADGKLPNLLGSISNFGDLHCV